jgi:nucleotide-binding universal stress UspA family protein
VVLLRVVIPLKTLSPYPEAMWALQMAAEADLEQARNYVQQIASSSRLMSLSVETAVIEGPAAPTILSFVGDQKIDLIVLCSHGYTGMKRWVLGSVAEKVSRHSPVPVLLLRENGPDLVETPPHGEFSLHALTPLDGSERAKESIIPAIQLMTSFATPGPGVLHLTLLIILPEDKDMAQSDSQTIVLQAKHYLNHTVEHTRERLVSSLPVDLKLSLTWAVIRYEDIAEGIIHEAQECDYMDVRRPQIIAMTTHGYSGLQRWTMGNITERVLHATRLPLLIVRPADMIDKD